MSSASIDDRAAMLRARLAALARLQGLGAEDARDAVQEAFSTLVALERRGLLVEGAPGSSCEQCALMSTLVINAARNMRRRHHRARPHLSGVDLDALIDARPLPEEAVAAAEDSSHLRGCMASLEEVPRKIVSLRIIEDLSGTEVARLLDLTPGHVRVLLHRAKKELTSCMARTAGG